MVCSPAVVIASARRGTVLHHTRAGQTGSRDADSLTISKCRAAFRPVTIPLVPGRRNGMATRSQKRRVDVRVFRLFRGVLPVASVRRAAAAALTLADPNGRSGASVVVADDETLHDLNLRFRGFDEVTDVLSFGEWSAPVEDTALPAGGPFPEDGFPAVPDEDPSLGEVVLSYPMAERQAREHNVPVEQETALLVVHGILHLLGHDHAEPEEEAAMRAIEQRALSALFPSENGTGAS